MNNSNDTTEYFIDPTYVDLGNIGEMIEDYCLKGKELPPIEVYLRRDGKYEVVDQKAADILYTYIITNHAAVCKVVGKKKNGL